MADTGLSGDDRPAAGTRTIDIAVSLLLLALALLFAFDSIRAGNSWASDGPQAGYFPFYLSILMGGAALYGLARAFIARAHEGEVFVTRHQLYRVMQVFVPTLLFCIATQFLGLYVASFLLVAGFMWWIGEIGLWKSVLASFLFSIAMFATFEIAFNVIMPKGPLEAVFGY
jgi:putative tricarboxylic transport membrane protein